MSIDFEGAPSGTHPFQSAKTPHAETLFSVFAGMLVAILLIIGSDWAVRRDVMIANCSPMPELNQGLFSTIVSPMVRVLFFSPISQLRFGRTYSMSGGVGFVVARTSRVMGLLSTVCCLASWSNRSP